MKIYFISDDQFFLYGLSCTAQFQHGNFIFINLNDACLRDFFSSIDEGAVLVAAIENNHLLSRLLNVIGFSHRRIVIIIDVPFPFNNITDGNVSLISKRTSAAALLTFLDDKKRSSSVPEYVSHRVLKVFNQSVNDESFTPLLSPKSTYRIRRKVVRQYGLESCNAKAIILCRDLLRMKVPF